MKFKRYRVPYDGKFDLSSRDPGDTALCAKKEEAVERVEQLKIELEELQRRLYASSEYGLLIVLQGMDAGGKDGAIRKVMSGVNPQGCYVRSFKVPSADEAAHDYLWRIHAAAPARGQIAIFNRSHYEEVLITRVHEGILAPWARRRKRLWDERYRQIAHFERHLAQNNIVVRKFMLHISKDEQKERMQARLSDPAANWKFSKGDLVERESWDAYQAAYQEALRSTSCKAAPWYVVPADHKWYRDLVITEVIVAALRRLKLEYPKVDPSTLQGIVVK